LIARLVNGHRKREWQKTRERNEGLDTRIYARAATSHFGIDRFQEQHWAALGKQMGIRAAAASPQPEVTTPAPEPAKQEGNQRSADPFSRDDRFRRDDRRPWFGNRKGWFDRWRYCDPWGTNCGARIQIVNGLMREFGLTVSGRPASRSSNPNDDEAELMAIMSGPPARRSYRR
jgi:hypothetical protein